MWWVDNGSQWQIGKFPRAIDAAATSKLWYISSASTGADVSGPVPPVTGWAVSAKANARAMGGTAAFSIAPPPTCEAMDSVNAAPAVAVIDMWKRGVKYASDGE